MCALRNRPHYHDSNVLINLSNHMSALIVRRHDSNVHHNDTHVRHYDSYDLTQKFESKKLIETKNVFINLFFQFVETDL